jgi:hypothetical protein
MARMRPLVFSRLERSRGLFKSFCHLGKGDGFQSGLSVVIQGHLLQDNGEEPGT